MRRFAGKVVLVTGAGSGIGAATARRFAQEGAAVAGLDMREESLEAVVAGIRSGGARAVGIRCDVSSEAEVGRAVAAAVAELGPPDVLCNIAGIGRFHPSAEMSLEQWQRTIDVNLTGTWLVARACLPHMLDRGGVIINTASTSGIRALPYQAAYCASKGGVIMLTKSLALEYWDRNLRVNAIAPGGVETPLVAEFADLPEGVSIKRLMRYVSPLGLCQPEEQAALYAQVASDDSRYMTGAVLVLDGGLTL